MRKVLLMTAASAAVMAMLPIGSSNAAVGVFERRGQAEPGDDRGRGRQPQPGDDRGGRNLDVPDFGSLVIARRGQAEPGDDRGRGRHPQPGDDRGRGGRA